MKKYVLNYYSAFRCAKGACLHTCCAGWEIPIDGETLAAYKAEQSDFSAQLKKGVNFKKAKFKTDKKGRCAFLAGDGLCRIITALGEGALCQVCRDHPRFRSFFGDWEEMGLGFCCEEAARIILSFPHKIELLPVSGCAEENHGVARQPLGARTEGEQDCESLSCGEWEQGGESVPRQNGESVPLDFNQQNVLNFRKTALRIVQNRTKGMDERIQELLSACRASLQTGAEKAMIKRFLSLERLDKGWTARLKRVRRSGLRTQTDESLTLCAEQFLANSLFRYLSDAEDTAWVRARAIACVLAWWLVQTVALLEANDAPLEMQNPLFAAVVEAARAFSCEVDYSQKNLDRLFAFAYQFVKI